MKKFTQRVDRQAAQIEALRKRTQPQLIARNVEPAPLLPPQFPARVAPTPAPLGQQLGNQRPEAEGPRPLHWKNTDEGVVRSDQRNSGYQYMDWRNWGN